MKIYEPKRIRIAGAQPKTSLYQATDGTWHKPVGGAPSTHILKPVSANYSDAALNETLCTLCANKLGLRTPDVNIIQTKIPMICTKRFDRAFNNGEGAKTLNGHPVPARLHHEDMCQALGIVPEHKYEEQPAQYLSRIASLVRSVSSNPAEDLIQLYTATVFNVAIGNCDAHLKNYALVFDAAWKSARLAPFYDLMSTSVYESLSQETAMFVGAKHKIGEIDRIELLAAAQEIELSPRLAKRQIDHVAANFESALDSAAAKLLAENIKGVSEFVGRLKKDAAPRLAALVSAKE